MTLQPKIRIRCGKHGCPRTLAEIYAPEDYDAAIAAAKAAPSTEEALVRLRRTHAYAPPADWSGALRVQPCPKHDKPRRNFSSEVLARAEAGYEDPRPTYTFHDIKWTTLAELYRRAVEGKTLQETIYD